MAKQAFELSPKSRLGPALGQTGWERRHGPRGAVNGACS